MDLEDLFFKEHPNPMFIYDYETLQILRVNRSAIKKYGFSREEFLDMSIEEIRPEEDIPLLHEALDEVSSQSKIFDGNTFRHQTKAGEILHVQVTAQFCEYDGKDARIVHIHDLSEMVKLKNKYKKTREITPKTVWWSLTDKQQQQFQHTVEQICQQLAGRVTRQLEGHDEAG
jgi:PAS domain S-box-containing protein